MPEFLLEVGCEEMPAGWLPGLTEQMRERFSELVRREHLEPEGARSFSRITLNGKCDEYENLVYLSR